MPVYVFPYPPADSSSDYGATGTPVNSTLQGLLDLVFDPLTRDLVDSADGGLVETADSRSMVIFQMEAYFAEWWADATQGSRLKAMTSAARGDDQPAEPQDLVDETKRCLQLLVNENVISDLRVSTDVDEAGHTVILMNYRDSASGNPVDLAYVPFAP